MAKILMISVPFYGHVNPTLALIKELVNRGHEVTYLVSEEFRSKVEAAGSTFEGYEFDMTSFFTVKNFKNMYDAALRIADDYDCIMYDFMAFFGKGIGDKFNKPTVRLISSFAWNKDISKNVFSNGDFKLKLIGNRLFRKIVFSKALKDVYIKTNDVMDEINENPADLNIVSITREFQIQNEKFDKNIYKFVGPSISDRNDKNDIPFNKMKDKIIYISLGTVFNNSLDFYKKCIEAFKDIDASIIMSVGKNTKIEDLGTIPGNFYVSNFVPQLDVLKHASLFITHGGMNSTNEAMYYGVPIIVVPQAVDQPIVGQRVEDLDLGMVINKKEVSSEKLRKNSIEILNNPKYKENMDKMRVKVREAGGEKAAANEIEKLLSCN